MFGYEAEWVDLPLETPIVLDNYVSRVNKTLTIAFDPAASQSKGIYFHYNEDPETGHSLVRTPSGGIGGCLTASG